ncbi:MAG TPA: hypothetical protein VJQ83_09365 [Tepidiformaceae bacterium]|nr:hypothetical protein [Tepidiformaceae bacterium]
MITARSNTFHREDYLPCTDHAGECPGVFDAAFSPDGQRIATASGDKSARSWDAATGQQLEVLTGHTDALARRPTPRPYRSETQHLLQPFGYYVSTAGRASREN